MYSTRCWLNRLVAAWPSSRGGGGINGLFSFSAGWLGIGTTPLLPFLLYSVLLRVLVYLLPTTFTLDTYPPPAPKQQQTSRKTTPTTPSTLGLVTPDPTPDDWGGGGGEGEEREKEVFSVQIHTTPEGLNRDDDDDTNYLSSTVSGGIIWRFTVNP